MIFKKTALRIFFIIPFIFIILFSSCETLIYTKGKTFDSISRQPINYAQVILILKGKDTIRKIHIEQDSLTIDQRKASRKQGIKDNYKWHEDGRFSKYSLSLSDTSGYFTVGLIVIPCAFKCPKCELLFVKSGYKQVTLEINSIKHDSVQVFLEKINE
jgi:hypothetical protein